MQEDGILSELEIETVNHAIGILQKWLCNSELYQMLPSGVVKHSIDVIVQLLDNGKDEKILQVIMNFANSVIKAVLSCNQLNNVC